MTSMLGCSIDGKNASQVINLGGLYCDLGKPKEALGSLVRLGTDMSSYGRMQEAGVRLDAAVQLGDTIADRAVGG